MKTKQIFIALIICIAMLLPCAPVFADATESCLTVGQTGGAVGTEVNLDVSLNEVNGIAGGSFTIVFDEHLTLVSAVAGDALNGRFVTINTHYAANTIRVSFAGMAPLSAAGSVVNLTFSINDDAPIDEFPVSVENVKLMDENADVVTRAGVNGSVKVYSAGLSLSSDSCLPGQAVKLDLSLIGELLPAGGSCEIHYNTHILTAASLTAEQKLGNTGINVSYGIDNETGVMKISWAASEPIDENGKFASLIFAVNDAAAGDTSVTIENVKLYDENANLISIQQSANGTVTVVDEYNEQPTLYVVGGQIDEVAKTATMRIAVDGSGKVYGGSFSVSYDTSLVTLQNATPQMTCVAVNSTNTASTGKLLVSWAEDSPSLDNETVLELTFSLNTNTSAELNLQDVVLKDYNGDTMEHIKVHSGKIGISGDLQAPIVEVSNEETSMSIEAYIYDAKFCSADPDDRTDMTTVFIAAYSEDQMRLFLCPTDAVSFDSDGIAIVDLSIPYLEGADKIQLFVLDGNNQFTPMGENTAVTIS